MKVDDINTILDYRTELKDEKGNPLRDVRQDGTLIFERRKEDRRKEESDGWIASTYVPKIPIDTLVQVRLRACKGVHTGLVGDWNWGHLNGRYPTIGDITHYRVMK